MYRIHDTVREFPRHRLAVLRMPFRSDRLKQLREVSGLTQQEVAGALGMTPQSYSAFERGKKEPNTERLIQLCRIFGNTADFLLGFVDEPHLRIEERKLRPDQRKLLELYDAGEIPPVILQIIGLRNPDLLQGNNDAPQIESGSKPDVPGKQKAS